MILIAAVGRVYVSDFALLSLPFLTNGASRSRECLNPEGEFHGFSGISLERQKEGSPSECQLFQPLNIQ
jgi:hypothetical protein